MTDGFAETFLPHSESAVPYFVSFSPKLTSHTYNIIQSLNGTVLELVPSSTSDDRSEAHRVFVAKFKTMIPTAYSPLYRYPFEEAAEVIVGHEKTKFIVHTSILCQQSTFFKAAFSQRWNAERTSITIPDTTSTTFNDYLTLVYRDKVAKATEVQAYFVRLIRLYLLADKLGDLKASNKTIDKIIKFSDRNASAPEYATVAMVMAATPENSRLRRLMVDFYVFEVTEQSFDEEAEDYLRGFHALVAKELVKLREYNLDETGVKDQPRCHYHQHDATYPRCKVHEEEEYEDDDDSRIIFR